MCGGTGLGAVGPGAGIGLSPRVRGNPGAFRLDAVCVGSIPACAGEPYGNRILRAAAGVYPRVCGGTPTRSVATPADIGLSPRVRGNRNAECQLRLHRGSIPACAGEPAGAPGLWNGRQVYPRVCGGTVARQPDLERGQGLSPRVRGNPLRVSEPAAGPGSIPACAGEPPFGRAGGGMWPVYPRVCGGTAKR